MEGWKKDEKLLEEAHQENPWFTQESIELAIAGIQNWLNKESLDRFSEVYQAGSKKLDIGIVMAGNIPLVGFHDLLCVLLSGHNAIVKLSSKDQVLMKALITQLYRLDPDLENRVGIKDRLNGIDAFIGTGSDNTNRYFDFYFGKLPHVFRRNRTSVGVIDNSTTKEEMLELGKDVFSFFGLGCRNVSKLFIEDGFEIEALIEVFQAFSGTAENHKYHQNYTYRKAIYLTAQQPFLDGGFFLLKEQESPFSMIGEINIQRFNDLNEVIETLRKQKNDIQTISGQEFAGFPYSKYGSTQFPEVDDFADGVDTMAFLCNEV